MTTNRPPANPAKNAADRLDSRKVANDLIAAGWDGSALDFKIPPCCPVCGEPLGGLILASLRGDDGEASIVPLVYCEAHTRELAAELLACDAANDAVLTNLFEG